MTQYQDFIDHQREQKDIAYYTQRFVLHPKQLQALQLPIDLTWQQTPFLPQNAVAVAEQTGVYAFVIQHDAKGLPPHGYVAYIGQTGPKTKNPGDPVELRRATSREPQGTKA